MNIHEQLQTILTFFSIRLVELGYGEVNVFFAQYGVTILIIVLFLYALIEIGRYILISQTKVVYFVRHGETILNARQVRQGPEGKLNERGVEQTKALAERLRDLEIQHIYASPFERTKETAAIIANVLHKKVILCDLLKERRNPSEIIGKSADDFEVMKIVNLIDNSFHENGLRFSDEENFDDLKKRSAQLLQFIEKAKGERLLMVTHGIFLKMIVSYVIKKDKLTSADYVKYSYYNIATNAGITICRYNPLYKFSKTRGWELIIWDSYDHKAHHLY